MSKDSESKVDDATMKRFRELDRQEKEQFLTAMVTGRKEALRGISIAREQMKDIAIALAPGPVDEYRIDSPAGIDVLTTGEMAQMVKDTVKEKISEIRRKRHYAEDLRRDAEEELEEVKAELQRVREKLREAQEEIDRLREHLTERSASLQPRPEPESESNRSRESERAAETTQSSPPPVSAPPGQAAATVIQGSEEGASAAPASASVEGQGASSLTESSNQRRGEKPPWSSMQPDLPSWNIRDGGATPQFEVSPDAWPEWAREWRDTSENRQSLKRDCDLIWVMGGTGLPLKRAVSERLGAWWDISPRSGSIQRAFKRAEALEVLEIFRPTEGLPYLVQLTENGRQIYRFLSGHDPVSSYTSRLMKRHKSPDHSALNVATAGILWRAGYEVELFPDTLFVKAGRYYPDLKARIDGQEIFVECERAVAAKDLNAMAHKWLIYHQVTNGYFYISTPTKADMEASRGQILEWAGDRSLVLRMMDVERVRGKEQHQHGADIWIAEHRVPAK